MEEQQTWEDLEDEYDNFEENIVAQFERMKSEDSLRSYSPSENVDDEETSSLTSFQDFEQPLSSVRSCVPTQKIDLSNNSEWMFKTFSNNNNNSKTMVI